MNAFFTIQKKYILDEPIDNIREKIHELNSRKWYELAENITGRQRSDGSYVLTNKLDFFVANWFELSSAYLNVTLSSRDDKTEVKLSVRPNSGLVISFYLIIFMFFYEAFGGELVKGSKTISLIFLSFFALLIFLLMRWFTTSLENRFARALNS
jgi:hypothetical protein